MRFARSASSLLLVLALALPAAAQGKNPPESKNPGKDTPPAKPAAEEAKAARPANLTPPADMKKADVEAFEKAEAALAKAIVSSKRGGEQEAANDLKEAIKVLESCALSSAQRKNPVIYFYAGMARHKKGENEEAVHWLKKAIALNPKFHEAITELGDALYDQGKSDKAEAEMTKALAIEPKFVPALLTRALIRNWAGKLADAHADVQAALEAEPRNKHAYLIKLVVDGPPWESKHEKETAHYIVRTNGDQALADKVAENAELILRLYESREMFQQPLPAGWPKKFPIIVFKDQESWDEFFGDRGKNFVGFYSTGLKQLFVLKQPFDEDTLSTVYHEGFHQFLHPRLQNAPTWFNEGMGDFFGATKYVKTPGGREGMLVRPDKGRLKVIKAAIQKDATISWKRMMTATQEELYDPRVIDLAYAESWSMVYFFCQYEDGRYFECMEKYYKALKAGKTPEQAFDKAFARQDWKEVEGAWRWWIQNVKAE